MQTRDSIKERPRTSLGASRSTTAGGALARRPGGPPTAFGRLLSTPAVGDGPVEGADGRAACDVVQALDDEAPGGAGESTRAARDGRGRDDEEEPGRPRRHALPGQVGRQRVAVG